MWLAGPRQPPYPGDMAFAHPKPVRRTLCTLIICFGTSACRGSLLEKQDAAGSDTAESLGDSVDLVDHDGWTQLSPDMDPFPDHRRPDHDCDPDGVLPEDGVLEVNTNDCGYAVLGQPISADIQPGDWVELLMYHSALASVESPAEGHFSLWLGDTEFWGRTITIPAAAEIYLVPIQVDWSLAAGTQARIHLHNHGGNSWRVAYIRRHRGQLPETLR